MCNPDPGPGAPQGLEGPAQDARKAGPVGGGGTGRHCGDVLGWGRLTEVPEHSFQGFPHGLLQHQRALRGFGQPGRACGPGTVRGTARLRGPSPLAPAAPGPGGVGQEHTHIRP